jgi:hypothetical protein
MSRLKVSFYLDKDHPEDPAEDWVVEQIFMHIGGYDIEIEEVADAPSVHRKSKPKRPEGDPKPGR